MQTHPLTTVLFDIDGTLLDSNEAHATSWLQTLRCNGHAVDYDTVRPLIGKGADRMLPDLLGYVPFPATVAKLTDERRAVFLRRYLPHLCPMPGAHALLKRLRSDGLRLVVATSAGAEELQALLQQAGIDDLLGKAPHACASDVAHSKPAPDILLAALESAGASPEEAILIGDTPYDIQSARAAGVDTIALRCGGGWSDDSLAAAVAIYDDPADLLRHLDDSPLGRRNASVASSSTCRRLSEARVSSW